MLALAVPVQRGRVGGAEIALEAVGVMFGALVRFGAGAITGMRTNTLLWERQNALGADVGGEVGLLQGLVPASIHRASEHPARIVRPQGGKESKNAQ